MLAIEERFPRHSAAKEQCIRETLAMTPARYYQLLARLVRSRSALAAEPMLVGRLWRQSQARRCGGRAS